MNDCIDSFIVLGTIPAERWRWNSSPLAADGMPPWRLGPRNGPNCWDRRNHGAMMRTIGELRRHIKLIWIGYGSKVTFAHDITWFFISCKLWTEALLLFFLQLPKLFCPWWTIMWTKALPCLGSGSCFTYYSLSPSYGVVSATSVGLRVCLDHLLCVVKTWK